MHQIPDSMTAIEVREPGGPEALVPCSRPVPKVEPGELLIKVAAAGVNRPDAMQRAGVIGEPEVHFIQVVDFASY